MRIVSWIVGVFAGVCLLVGAAPAEEKAGSEPAYSGFLGTAYADLKEAQSPSGGRVKRWISPEMTPGKYDSVMLDPSIYYPQPRGTEHLGLDTLNEVSIYFDEALRRELYGLAKMVTKPGPNTLRLKVAITGVDAVGSVGLAFEFQALDAGSGRLLAAGMRKGDGAHVSIFSRKERLTLVNFKPIIDTWAKDARVFVETMGFKP